MYYKNRYDPEHIDLFITYLSLLFMFFVDF